MLAASALVDCLHASLCDTWRAEAFAAERPCLALRHQPFAGRRLQAAATTSDIFNHR
jgi:hypothetical protein